MNLDEQSRQDNEKLDGRLLALVMVVAMLAMVAFYIHHSAEAVHAGSGAVHERVLVQNEHL